MLLTVLIPIYNLDNERKRNLEFIYNRLIHHYKESEIEIIFGIQDQTVDRTYYDIFDRAIIRHYNHESLLFNKSYIFNRCCEDGIGGEFLVFLDADVYLPFHKLKYQLSNNQDIIKPFNECIFLDSETTTEFLLNKTITPQPYLKRITATGACCIILNSKILDHVRMDENFVGWGWEDIDFANDLTSRFDITIIDQPAVHLYHKPISPNNNNYLYYNKKHKYIHTQYSKSIQKDIGIIIAYFSPCNYKLPKQNLMITLESLKITDCPVTVIEAIMPNAEPLVLPEWIDHHKIKTNIKNILFLKENLYNIGIKNTNYSKIIFMDSDILFSDPNWIDKSSLLLDTHDVIQPFESCIWLDRENIPLLDFNFKPCMCKSIIKQQIINPLTHHPGFAWGVTRNFLSYTNGVYDKHPMGGSDIAFSCSICPNPPPQNIIDRWTQHNQLWINTNAYKKYRELVQSYNPKINYLKKCLCRHLYHGSFGKRDYIDRNKKYLPELIDNDYPVSYNNMGILEWQNEEHGLKCLEYFKSRREDD